jgi:trk system potassium uptake protein TrkA
MSVERMKALVIGAGEVGTIVARTLSADGHEVTVIENDPARCEQAREELDAMVVEGNGASPRILRENGAGQMDLLAAVTAVDEVNIAAAAAAHQLRVKTTVARVRDPDFFGQDGAFAKQLLGIDFVIDPDRAAAADIAESVKIPGAVSVEYFGEGELALAEVVVTESSPVADIPLAERERPYPAFIAGISHNGEPHLTRPEMIPMPGDHLLITCPRQYVRKAVAHLAGKAHEVRKVVVFGGGKIGLQLTRHLCEAGIGTTILEREEKRARLLAEKLPGALIIHDEGISKEAQSSAGVADADVFVACAGDDRANLLAAINGKRLGAGVCLATVSREEFTPLVDALAIDAAFSPRLIAAEAILKFVHTTSVKGIHLHRTGFEAIEMEVRPGARIVGMAIGETHGLLRHCRVGAILSEGEVSIPSRGSQIGVGDRLLMLGPFGTMNEVEQAFAGNR